MVLPMAVGGPAGYTEWRSAVGNLGSLVEDHRIWVSETQRLKEKEEDREFRRMLAKDYTQQQQAMRTKREKRAELVYRNRAALQAELQVHNEQFKCQEALRHARHEQQRQQVHQHKAQSRQVRATARTERHSRAADNRQKLLDSLYEAHLQKAAARTRRHLLRDCEGEQVPLAGVTGNKANAIVHGWQERNHGFAPQARTRVGAQLRAPRGVRESPPRGVRESPPRGVRESPPRSTSAGENPSPQQANCGAVERGKDTPQRCRTPADAPSTPRKPEDPLPMDSARSMPGQRSEPELERSPVQHSSVE